MKKGLFPKALFCVLSIEILQKATMKKLKLLTGLLLGIFCAVAYAESAKNIRIGGGGGSCMSQFTPYQKPFTEETGINLSITPTNPVQGLIDLHNGLIDVAASPLSMGKLISGAAKEGVVIDPDLYAIREIGVFNTLVFVHGSNKIPRLSKKQLQDIFTGKIRNWKQVGGDERKIIVVWGQSTPGQNQNFTEQILDGKKVLSSAMKAKDYTEIRDKVIKYPGAIGIDPLGFACAATRNPETPLVSSEVIAVTKGRRTPEVELLLKFIKDINW